MELPEKLHNSELRFYRINKDSKIPIDKGWTSKNNWHYNHQMIKSWNGNLGIVCGYGSIIVLDFDDKDYHESIKHKLPKTFTVITATKRLPHYYYYFKGDMFKKTAIKDDKLRTLCDIQGQGSGIVAPNSVINYKYYEPNNVDIATITTEQLQEIFNIDLNKYKEYQGKEIDLNKQTNKTKLAYASLLLAKVKLSKDHPMRCPFHEMHGNGNLVITPAGKIHCFHENKSWWADEFIEQYFKWNKHKTNKIIRLLKNIFNIKL